MAGGPGATRTPDPKIRSLVLYPAELRDRIERMILPDLRGLSIPNNQGLGPGGRTGAAGEVRGQAVHESPSGGQLATEHEGEVAKADVALQDGLPAEVGGPASRGDQGTASVTIQSLLEASLRMRPDRLFVGEVRGSEAFAFLRAINTGHPGSMSTVHADTPLGAYEQLAMMVMQSGLSAAYPKADLISYIQSVIPIVIQLRRDGGRRGVSEIFFARGRTDAS